MDVCVRVTLCDMCVCMCATVCVCLWACMSECVRAHAYGKYSCAR
jgi:hypothetical protein